MAKTVFVDRDECTGCGLCTDELPEVFKLDDEGLSVVHNPNGAAEDRIQNVIDSCPAECIHWK